MNMDELEQFQNNQVRELDRLRAERKALNGLIRRQKNLIDYVTDIIDAQAEDAAAGTIPATKE